MIKVNRLPQGYKELEYIEGNGSRVIDLGISPNDHTRVETKFSNDSSDSWYIFGSRSGSSGAIQFAQSGSQTGGTIFPRVNGAGAAVGWIRTAGVDLKCEVILETKGTKYDYSIKDLTNTRNYSVSDASYTPLGESSPSMGIFGFNSNNRQAGTTRFYYFRMYKNGTLVRNMIPCKNPQNVVGMYDLANGVFYTDESSGTFTAGPIAQSSVREIHIKKDGVMKDIIEKYANGRKVFRKALPDGYKELTYIQNTGDSYLLIPDMTITNNDNFSIKFAVQSTSPSARVFSPTDGASPFFNGSTANGTISSNYQFGMGGSWINGPTLVVDALMEVKNVGSKMTFNGTAGDRDVPAFSRPTFDLFVFRGNYNGAEKSCHCKIYEFKINGKFYLVPAKNAQGVVGMYDLVTDTFYTNQGTGDFVAGEEV